jgi:hypothetical protein
MDKKPPELNIRGLSLSRVWDYENGFYWFSHPTRIAKQLAHFELYQRIVALPGHIVECGVYKAASLLRWATYRQILETEWSREIIALDAFGAFPKQNVVHQDDQRFISEFEDSGGPGLTEEEVGALARHKGFSNISLVKGDVNETIPRLLAARTELRIALLHLDLDVENATRFCLEQLAERLVPGGLVVIDDFNAVGGATRAAEEFCRRRNIRLQKLPFYTVPAWFENPGGER